MNIKITVNPYENEKTKMLGYATVNFEDKYVLENIKIKNGQYGRYVELPKYSTPKKDDNGKIIENIYGKPEFEYKDIFHPLNADMNKEFTDAILTEYKNVIENGKNTVYKGDKRSTGYTLSGDFDISRTTAGVHSKKNDNDNLLGMASMGFGNSFILEKIKIKESVSEQNKGNTIIELPKYRTTKTDEHGKPILDDKGQNTFEYRDAFHAISTEGYSEMFNAVVNAYNGALAVKQTQNTDISQDGIPFDDIEDDQTRGR